MAIYIPYTYLIGWSKLDKWYYGVRFAKNCHPNELWKQYFSSSKHVTAYRKEHGEPDVIQIRKTFESREQAHRWEGTVLRRLHRNTPFGLNCKWLNRNAYPAIIYDVHPLLGVPKSEESKLKQSLSTKGRIGWIPSEEVKERRRQKMKQKWKNGEMVSLDISRNPRMLGKKHSLESRQLMSLSQKNKKFTPETLASFRGHLRARYEASKTKCPHCDKVLAALPMGNHMKSHKTIVPK